MAEIQAHSETRLSRLEESFALLVQMAKLTDERQDATDQRITQLTEKVNTLVEKMEQLAETQKSSDERLNTLIGIFERYISEGRNGNSR
jgi:FtsZ-binding cell division protein ZapB